MNGQPNRRRDDSIPLALVGLDLTSTWLWFARYPRMTGPRSEILLVIVAFWVTTQVAAAFTIQFRYGEDFPQGSPQRQAIEWAADRWEANLQDPVVVTIDVSFDDLTTPSGTALGSTEPASVEFAYSEVRDALLDDATSIDDQLATSHLPPGPDVAFRTCDSQGTVITRAGSETINQVFSMTRANAKALRLSVTDDPEQADATIRFNEDFLGPKLR